jgi:hypothetical protein
MVGSTLDVTVTVSTPSVPGQGFTDQSCIASHEVTSGGLRVLAAINVSTVGLETCAFDFQPYE